MAAVGHQGVIGNPGLQPSFVYTLIKETGKITVSAIVGGAAALATGYVVIGGGTITTLGLIVATGGMNYSRMNLGQRVTTNLFGGIGSIATLTGSIYLGCKAAYGAGTGTYNYMTMLVG